MDSSTQLNSDFSKHLLKDLRALELMLSEGLFEKGITRLGAEQEFCTIDYALKPAMVNQQVLDRINDPHFTTELAKFNLEANLDPLELKENCFSALENDLILLLTKANRASHDEGAKIILTGILPTIRHGDIVLDNMTPNERYYQLNDAILKARDGNFKFNIIGLDELITESNTVLFESCNTSFQIHYQTEPDLVNNHYNWAHMISGPVLAACTNSPIFLGKRLWSETRIALFQQSADTRKTINPHRKQRARVTFGNSWRTGGPLEIFRDTVQRYKVLLPIDISEDSEQVLQSGRIPKLKALCTHNGTVYRWNRLCYGITGSKPHLRIENRYIPSGPTIIDEVSNTAFWIGLMHGVTDKYKDLPSKMSFDKVKNNFLVAAKEGLKAQFQWLDEKLYTAQDLILKELIPIAEAGLTKAGVDPADIQKYLKVIEERVTLRKTGSSWILDSFEELKKNHSTEEVVVGITEGIYQRQKKGLPVHNWSALKMEEAVGWESKYQFVNQIMATDLLTVQKGDLLEMAVNILLWSNINHLPVENSSGELIGLLTSDLVLKWHNDPNTANSASTTVADVMLNKVATCDPKTTTKEAYFIMKNQEVGCLPVVENDKLIGLVTLHAFVKLMEHFLEDK